MSNILLPKPALGTPIAKGQLLSKGLVANFPFSDGRGDILSDFSLEKNDGLITGPTWQGDGLAFNGTSDYVSIPDNAIYEFPSGVPFSVCVLFKTGPRNITSTELLIAKGLTGGNKAWGMGFTGAEKLLFGQEEDGFVVTNSTAFVDGNWHFVVGRYDGEPAFSGLTIYVDGLLQPTATAGSFSLEESSEPLVIGARSDTSVIKSHFDGDIQYVSIYDRALSQSEIAALSLNPNLPMQQPPIWLFTPPVVVGLSIPIAMHHYKQMQGVA